MQSPAVASVPPPAVDHPPAAPRTLTDVVNAWRSEGPLVRVPTGIEALDRLCRGGLPVPWRVVLVGAPSAGKTGLGVILADHLARIAGAAGLCVGILAVDEDPEDLAVRFAQLAGFSVAEAEQRRPDTLDRLATALRGLRVRLYDGRHSIESAAADLADWCEAEQSRGMLMVDSLQAAHSDAGPPAATDRELVTANVRAIRDAGSRHRLLTVATSEANRVSYRDPDATQSRGRDMASGAESRAIEFSAQTLLMLRTPEGHDDVISVSMPKNRRADRGTFWLRLDRETHTVAECANPTADPRDAIDERRATRQAERSLRDALKLVPILEAHPAGLGELALRRAAGGAGLKWGPARLNAARDALVAGVDGVRLVDIGEERRRCWVLRRDEPVS